MYRCRLAWSTEGANTMKKITAKLGTMRKAVEWVVYPPQNDSRIIIQSSTYIAAFAGPQNAIPQGKCLLSKRQSGGAYFVHLSPMCGASFVDLPDEVLAAALAAQPKSGDQVGPGVVFA